MEECGLKREIRRDVMTSQMCTVDVQKGADVLIACYLMRWMSYPDSDLLFFFGGDGDFYPLFKFNKLFFGKVCVILCPACPRSFLLCFECVDSIMISYCGYFLFVSFSLNYVFSSLPLFLFWLIVITISILLLWTFAIETRSSAWKSFSIADIIRVCVRSSGN